MDFIKTNELFMCLSANGFKSTSLPTDKFMAIVSYKKKLRLALDGQLETEMEIIKELGADANNEKNWSEETKNSVWSKIAPLRQAFVFEPPSFKFSNEEFKEWASGIDFNQSCILAEYLTL